MCYLVIVIPQFTSVHMLFDESIPERPADYFRELDEATAKCNPDERRVSDFDCHDVQHYIDETTRVEGCRTEGPHSRFSCYVTAGRHQG